MSVMMRIRAVLRCASRVGLPMIICIGPLTAVAQVAPLRYHL